ncbi:extended synaptotagmin-2-like [Cylas formicarius]|uniref:extended synaptotagmin-2-like n=1 Tax=Cylas formicarius TaxID=197179 RepID=UPI0029584135|nr:extended synaptotagmin-2-like [Cylas formicarius]XP_060517284.1 extended synaptotagmin-2-like [Cylas formicarius]
MGSRVTDPEILVNADRFERVESSDAIKHPNGIKPINSEKIMFKNVLVKFSKRAFLVLVGYLVCYLNVSLILPVLALCTFIWYDSTRSEKTVKIRQKIAASGLTKEHFKKIVEELPSWVTFPDRERAEWLNEIITQLWPSLNCFVVKYCRGKIQTNIRKKVDSFRFEDLDFGNKPPKIDGVKVYDKFVAKEAVIIDFEVFYDGDCDINFSVSGTQVGRIRDFQMGVDVRVVLKPILLKSPIIGGVQIFFLNLPDISFDLEGITGIPGLSYIVRQKIEEIIYKKVVFPNNITKRFTKTIEAAELKSIEPEGVLRVHVFEAKDLEKKDVTGKSDPYVILNVGAQEFKTHIIKRDLNPKWDCYCEFIVLDPLAQQLYFKLYDQDEFREDDFLGSGAVEIFKVIKDQDNDRWFALDDAKHGKIHLRFSWLGLSAQRDNVDAALQETRLLKTENLHSALLVVYVDSAVNLKKIKSYKKPDPYMVLTVGRNQVKSRVKKHTTNPIWEQGFYLLVRNPENDSLIVNIIDKHTDATLDRFVYSVRSLLGKESMQVSKEEIELSANPNSKIIVSVQLRILHNALFETDYSDSDPEEYRPNEAEEFSRFDSEENESNKLIEESIRKSQSSSVGAPPTIRTSQFQTLPEHLGRIELTLSYSELRQKLLVTVHRVANLPLIDPAHIPDPYVKLRLGSLENTSVKGKTKVVVDSCDPIFEEDFEYLLSENDLPTQKLVVTVKNKKLFSSSVLGQTVIGLKGLQKVEEPVRGWYDLTEEQVSD